MKPASAPPPPVRSYMVRAGRLTNGQQRALHELWPIHGLALPPPSAEPLDSQQIFGRCAPLCFEIGFGDGDGLLQMAEKNPQCNFIGVDVYRPGIGRLLLELESRKLTNVKIFCEDGVAVLCLIAPRALQSLHLYFPDPWPKKRHHKRRLVQADFIELVATKLCAGGSFYFATDWQPYAEQALQLLEQSRQLENCAGCGKFSPRPEHRALTKFERRGHKLGHQIYDIVMRKSA